MIAAARKRSLHVEQHDATTLPFNHQFDAVFSNAALHWITGVSGQESMLAGVHRALRHGGRFVAEMGDTATSPPSAPLSKPPSRAFTSMPKKLQPASILTRNLLPPTQSRWVHNPVRRPYPASHSLAERNGSMAEHFPQRRSRPAQPTRPRCSSF